LEYNKVKSKKIDLISLKSFRKSVKKLFTESELDTLFDFLSQFPEKGSVIPGTNGLRKLRWALTGKGKKGGSRIIYYYHRSESEVLLLTAYAKNEKKDLSAKDKKILIGIIADVLGE